MSAASAAPRLEDLVAEAQRVLAICNACRYCEGFCAVFPALERRLSFSEGDVHYLANLCHNCGSCLYACQYAPPHEFQLNFPRVLAQVRKRSYQRYAWPRAFAAAFERNALAVALTGGACLALFLIAMALLDGAALFQAHPDSEGAFYAVLPHRAMAAGFGLVSIGVAVAFAVSFIRFWRDMDEPAGDLASAASGGALADALTLKYLDGGGEGCTYPRDKPSFARRNFHHLTFYGFMLCFAATCVATLYHYAFGWKAPYGFWSLPVLLGTAGGAGLLAGPAGLLFLRRRRDPALADASQDGMDVAFLALLFLVSLTGLLLLGLRETAALGALLAVHLGLVLALFLTLPYGKFVHALYRLGALARFHAERRRPIPETGPE